jgi:uncharacterized protein (TIGR03083 family)
MTPGSLAALRAERQGVLDFCGDLTTDEWAAPSRADGWAVKDVVAHMTAGMRALITPAAVQAMTTNHVERFNDQTVDKSRSLAPEQILDGFRAWSKRGVTTLALLTAPGIGRVPLRVGELGSYPLNVFPCMYLFDWHTHLRQDIAPAIDRPAPPTDDQRMSAVMIWLMALLEQSHRDRLAWLDAPLALTLSGPGGGTWRIEPTPKGALLVRPGTESGTTAQISGQTLEFPEWSTTRANWRDRDVKICGDTVTAERFLDLVNLV